MLSHLAFPHKGRRILSSRPRFCYNPLTMKTFILLIAVLLFAAMVMGGCFWGENEFAKNLPAKEVELSRYLGRWYEIARMPSWFEKDLVGVTATYTLKDNGEIEVRNAGFDKTLSGERKESVGRAWIPDPAQSGRLKVSFFGPFAGDYVVFELDPEYRYALVGSSKDLFWILSREPQMDEGLYLELLAKAEAAGYDLEKLIKVEQPIDD